VRYLGVPISQAFDVTAGRIYRTLINKEIKGDCDRKNVQIIPRITGRNKRTVRIARYGGRYYGDFKNNGMIPDGINLSSNCNKNVTI